MIKTCPKCKSTNLEHYLTIPERKSTTIVAGCKTCGKKITLYELTGKGSIFDGDEYSQQTKVPESIAEFGIKEYTKDQKNLHKDIMKLMNSKKYKEIPADDCMIVFGRIYSIYVVSQLKKEGFKFGDKDAIR